MTHEPQSSGVFCSVRVKSYTFFYKGGGGENYHNYAENIWRHRTKFHRPGDQAPEIFVLVRTTSEQSIQVTTDSKTRNSNNTAGQSN